MKLTERVQGFINSLRPTPKMGAHNFIGHPSFAHQNPYLSMLDCYQSDAYASVYPSIRAISQEFMTIRPYAINSNGEKVKHPALDALYHPNKEDSSVAFFEKLAVSTLFLPKTYLLVWRRQGPNAVKTGTITPNNIAGYTFLEFPAVSRVDGRTTYTMGSETFDEDEVIVIPGGTNPNALYDGYTPSEAARRWATLDDYIADYQKGFFENGAVPAGQFVITAPTKKEFEDIVNTMQNRHRGAGKNNNITYTPRPIDPNTKQPSQAQIEWIPFASPNKDIDFKNLFEQTNKRIDLAYGVPQIVKGVDDAATYANAQVAEATFAKRAVKPLALRIYTQITHELNRITNGLGIAITFQYDIPAVADSERVVAETKNIEANMINTLINTGYQLDNIVDAFGLSQSYKLLTANTTETETDETDIDEGGEVNSSPNPQEVDGYRGEAKRTNPKAEITEIDRKRYQDQLADVVRSHMQSQINRAKDNAQNITQEEEAFVDDMLNVIYAVMVAQGAIEYAAGAELLRNAGVSTDPLTAFVLSDDAKEKYDLYLQNVGKSYMDDTRSSIQSTLSRANTEGWTKHQTDEALQNIMNTDEWRVTRLSVSEINRSQQTAGVESMLQIQDETQVTIKKVWQTTSDDPCPICQALDGTEVGVEEAFLDKGGSIQTAPGEYFVNDFVDMDAAQAHPNDYCVVVYKVVR